MTGSWLIVKWVGAGILASYSALLLVVFCWFRAELSRLRSVIYLPQVLGNCVAFSVPWIFENLIFARACFVIAQVIYVSGIVLLVRGLLQADHGSLLRA
jgi:hypothetical protein